MGSFVTEIPSPGCHSGKGFPLRRNCARKKERDEEIKKIITGESTSSWSLSAPARRITRKPLWIMCPVWSRCRRRRRTAW